VDSTDDFHDAAGSVLRTWSHRYHVVFSC